MLGVHGVVGEVLGRDGAEGVEADVERDFGEGDAGGVEAVEEFLREVKSGGGRGGGAGTVGIDGLIAGDVVGEHFAAADVVGERDAADLCEERDGRVGGLGDGGPNAGVVFFDEHEASVFRTGAVEEGDELAGLDAAAGLAEDLPAVFVVGGEEKAFPFAAGGRTDADDAGGDDAGVVDDEAIGGGEEFGQIADVVVGERLGVPVDDEEAGVGADG